MNYCQANKNELSKNKWTCEKEKILYQMKEKNRRE